MFCQSTPDCAAVVLMSSINLSRAGVSGKANFKVVSLPVAVGSWAFSFWRMAMSDRRPVAWASAAVAWALALFMDLDCDEKIATYQIPTKTTDAATAIAITRLFTWCPQWFWPGWPRRLA